MSDAGQEPVNRAFLANASFRAHYLAGIVFEPPPPIDYNWWAEEYLEMGPESPFPGKYRSERFPFFVEILVALSPDDPSRVIVVRGSAQIGKTFLAQIFIAASMDLDPGHFLYVHPTVPNAARFARSKWRPLIRATKQLALIFDSKQSKEGGNSTLHQERRDGRGSLMLGGANSAASLSMISVRRQVQDDVSKWENNTAGDPESQAESRSKAFDDAKIFKLSTPMISGSCRITRAFERGTQEFLHVPCPSCSHMHPLEPENFIANIDPDNTKDVHFTCPACSFKIREQHRAAIVRRGRWIAHNPSGIDRSFSLWACYAPLERWHRMAQAYLDAMGDPFSEQTWWNDTAGRAYELPGEAPPWQELKQRADARGRQLGQIPFGALLLTLTFDVQDDYIDGVVTGFGENLRRWTIARIRIDGFIAEPETRVELNRCLQFEWPTAWGTKRKVDICGIDANAFTDDVLEWAGQWPKSEVVMLRGVGGDTAPNLSRVRRERRPDGRLVKYQGRFFNVGVNGIKGALYKFLRVSEPEARGYCDFPAGLDDDYYEQLTAEKRTPTIDRRGFTVFAWIKPRRQRNEQLDVAVYAQALATKLGWRIMTTQHWARLAAAREDRTAELSAEHAATEFWGKHEAIPTAAYEEPPPPPPPPRSPPPPRRSMVIRSNFGRRGGF